LTLNLKRISLAELLEANAGMQRLVAERILLDKLVCEHKEMEATIQSKDDASLIADFLAQEDRIYSLMERLKLVGRERLKSTPLYYHEAQVGYINTLADTLSSNLESEITELVTSIELTKELYQNALEDDDGRHGI